MLLSVLDLETVCVDDIMVQRAEFYSLDINSDMMLILKVISKKIPET